MEVSRSLPAKIVYSLFQHEDLGFLFESFMVQLDQKGRLTFQYQNISAQNSHEFAHALDDVDYQLVELMDSMQQEVVVPKFCKKPIKPIDFFIKYYRVPKYEDQYRKPIEAYLEKKRAKILELIQTHGKQLYEMGNDGDPTRYPVKVSPEKSTILFHFRRNANDTHYFPTIKNEGEKVEFRNSGAFLLCHDPAWMICRNQLYGFERYVDGKKLKPFLNKKFILIPKALEEKYYYNFVSRLIEQYDVYAKGFEIVTRRPQASFLLRFSEISDSEESNRVFIELMVRYEEFLFRADGGNTVSVQAEKVGADDYVFHRIGRNVRHESAVTDELARNGIELIKGVTEMPASQALEIIGTNCDSWAEHLDLKVEQGESKNGSRYFLGKPTISLEVKESIDWFDIHAVIKFGPYRIPFKELRHLMINKKGEFKLPNGEIAVIPSEWRLEYSELFAFLDDHEEDCDNTMRLKKFHVALLNELKESEVAKISMDRKLAKLRDFSSIEDVDIPKKFEGELRPYQKAGYNWLNFLRKFRFGGCLADDMGLGKTVQTLALLQKTKEEGAENASLLIMPTSLIYNWQAEARKFTPDLRVFTYTGTNRVKDPEIFKDYDLILTSYGIARLDIDILSKYYFNYAILDESQMIKNPGSNIAKAVGDLRCQHRLALTGTPLENSTLDLWSQLNFVNPGLLGGQTFFRNEFLNPIEKKGDEKKTHKLNAIIKPFILRRHKSQVATELPEKVIQVKYSVMTDEQEKAYEQAKSTFRNKILDEIETHGVSKSHFLLLQGLTKLRQIANHPKMALPEYEGDSGKSQEVQKMIVKGIKGGHKILVFSQFVKHLTLVRQFLDKEEIEYAYLDGTTRDREKQVQSFQENEDIKVFLISLKAGGVGLNLTRADYVFILDPWWNPAIEAQAVDRAHRIGQMNKVFTYKFIGKNTVEEKILALQEKKNRLAGNLIVTEENFMKDLSQEDIENLLA
ncbi:hypothetical protein FUAX_37610 [Fulvitalea axinellae]|uniref:DEAD/DEAH box helicase n=1 Tax=Fulvitalea axinellae TaxID=1182444 RepID=A0AAU9D9R9_9BACT|nr:hypothetical protein FUAX_37610 [Fulvitalea axinellae]